MSRLKEMTLMLVVVPFSYISEQFCTESFICFHLALETSLKLKLVQSEITVIECNEIIHFYM